MICSELSVWNSVLDLALKTLRRAAYDWQPTLCYYLGVDQDVNKPAQELSQEILRKTMTIKQTNPPTQKEGRVLTEASPYSTCSKDVTRTHLRKPRTSLCSSTTDFTFQKSLARSRRGSAFPCPWFRVKNSLNSLKHQPSPWAGTSDSARLHLTSPRHPGGPTLCIKAFPEASVLMMFRDEQEGPLKVYFSLSWLIGSLPKYSVARKQEPLWLKQAPRAGLGLRTEETALLTRAVGWRSSTRICVRIITPWAQALLCFSAPRALQDASSGEPLVFPAGALTRHSLLYCHSCYC